MSCNRFQAYELGRIGEKAFQRHVESCAVCRDALGEDERLMGRVRELKEPVEAPWLWSRIEAHLEAEKSGTSRRFIVPGRWAAALRFASFLALGIIGGMIVIRSPRQGGSGLLTDAALRKVERRERGYENAITSLEQRADRRMAGMDVELMLLYRDRLETIDAQIARCREALVSNPANTHIRNYMLAALQDKKKTLKELL